MRAATIDLLQGAIADPDTQWNLGTFGAIAEFSRDRDEPVALCLTDDDGAMGGRTAPRLPQPVSAGSRSINRSRTLREKVPTGRTPMSCRSC